MDRDQLAWARHLFELRSDGAKLESKKVFNTDDNTHVCRGENCEHRDHANQFYLNKQTQQKQCHQPKKSKSILVLLFILGCIAGVVNGCIMWAEGLLCSIQLNLIMANRSNYGLGFLYFLLSSIGFGLGVAVFCKYLNPTVNGSGLPEIKYLLASEVKETEYHRFLCWEVFVAKSAGLILAGGAGMQCCVAEPQSTVTG
jgi:hypothetical protein